MPGNNVTVKSKRHWRVAALLILGAASYSSALLSPTIGQARAPSIESGCLPPSTRVFMAATAGSHAFVDPRKNFPTIMAGHRVGMSITNGSLYEMMNPQSDEGANLRGNEALQAFLKAWSHGYGSAIGLFFSPQMTPDVPRSHYHAQQSTIADTSLLQQAITDGFHPALVELDVSLSAAGAGTQQTMSDDQLSDAKAAMTDLKHSTGARVILPWLSPNNGVFGDFGRDPKFANERKAASFGGGIAIDSPSNFWFASGKGYQHTVISEIHWARENGLVSMVGVSPFALGTPGTAQWNYDPSFLESTKKIYQQLDGSKALPTFWLSQNYTPAAAREGNRPWTETKSESISQVALWLAEMTPPRPSKQGRTGLRCK